MIEAGRRCRNLPAPPHIVAASLRAPDEGTGRRWLKLQKDEQLPRTTQPDDTTVVWTSLWSRQPEAVIRFELTSGGGGTDLCWILLVDELPDASRLGHYRKRINELINRDLRLSYGQ